MTPFKDEPDVYKSERSQQSPDDSLSDQAQVKRYTEAEQYDVHSAYTMGSRQRAILDRNIQSSQQAVRNNH